MKKTTKRKLILEGEAVKVLATEVDLRKVHGGGCTNDDSGCGSIIRAG
jgi:hypothetical protein